MKLDYSTRTLDEIVLQHVRLLPVTEFTFLNVRRFPMFSNVWLAPNVSFITQDLAVN